MDIEVLAKAIACSRSWESVSRYLQFPYCSKKNRELFKRLASENEIDISHFKLGRDFAKRESRVCPVCKTTFEVSAQAVFKKTTCSYKCSNRHFRSGRDNANWKEDKESDRHRIKCFAYHPFKCVLCSENRILDVHHYDHNKNNNSPENLIPLCPTHRRYMYSEYVDEFRVEIEKYREEFINGM